MDRLLVILVLVAVVGAAVAVYRVRDARRELPRRVDAVGLGLLGDGRRVVLFTSPYCLACKEWGEALDAAGVDARRVDVATEHHLAHANGITVTPVVLAVDAASGRVVAAADDHPDDASVRRIVRAAAMPSAVLASA